MKELPSLLTIAERIKYARKLKGLTMQELANSSGTTRAAIQKIELGKTNQPRNLEEIAKSLDVSPAWLAFGLEEIDHLSHDAIVLAQAWDSLPNGIKEALQLAILTAKPKD